MATGNLGCVVVAVDGSEESMKALQWALDNLRLRPGGAASEEGGEVVEPGVLVVLHVQSPPSIAAGLNPGPIPFGGPSKNHAIVNHSIISLIFFLLSYLIWFSFLHPFLCRDLRWSRCTGVLRRNWGAPEADYTGNHGSCSKDLWGQGGKEKLI